LAGVVAGKTVVIVLIRNNIEILVCWTVAIEVYITVGRVKFAGTKLKAIATVLARIGIVCIVTFITTTTVWMALLVAESY
jgi:hypothetical protein